MDDLISRQAAIEAPEKFIKDCNPEHFVGHQKFIEFMDDAEIGSFGNWQFANGFNMGLTAAEVAIEKLPSAQPERKRGRWVYYPEINALSCSICRRYVYNYEPYKFCPNCGSYNGGENEE